MPPRGHAQPIVSVGAGHEKDFEVRGSDSSMPPSRANVPEVILAPCVRCAADEGSRAVRARVSGFGGARAQRLACQRAVAVRGIVSAPTPCVHGLAWHVAQAARPALVLRVAARKMAALTEIRRGRGGKVSPCGAQHLRVDEGHRNSGEVGVVRARGEPWPVELAKAFIPPSRVEP